MTLEPTNFQPRVALVQILLSDVDGVLTDGKLVYTGGGDESKSFHVRDGLAVKLWKSCGLPFGLITARESECVARRASELGVDFLIQKRSDKLQAIREITDSLGLTLENVCYVGDDLHDLAAIQAVGLGVTVSDGAQEVMDAADFQTTRRGGEGALRELVEVLLKTKGKWNEAIANFSTS